MDSAKIWDAPEVGVPIAAAVSGDSGIDRFAELADHLIAVEPDSALVEKWSHARKDGAAASRAIGQIPICWDPDEQAAEKRAHEQFRWFGGGWPVNSNLPTPESFAAATQFVRPEDVASAIPCGPNPDHIVQSVQAYWDAGFTDIALVQVGGDSTQQFLDEAAQPLLDRLREASAAAH